MIAGLRSWRLIGVVLLLSISGCTAESPPASSVDASASSETSTPPQPSASLIPASADDHLLQVAVDELRMRATASTTADIVRTLDLGEVVRVKSGPVEADGYAWSAVVDLDSRTGWVAMGGGAQPWLMAVPSDPATSPLLLRLERACDAVELDTFDWRPADVTLSGDRRFVLVTGVVRTLSPTGFDQVQREALQLPILQASADYQLEFRPGAPEAPGHGACVNRFTLGEGTSKVVVTATNWQGDEEEALYFVPSPERRALDALALHLLDVEAWLGSAGWSDPASYRYVSGSYRFSVIANGRVPPDYVNAPRVDDVPWPFDGPIEQFGDPEGDARCGYLDLGQAFETLRLMRQWGVHPLANEVDPASSLTLDRFGAGNFTTEAGWFSFWLTPRSPDGYPGCSN